MTSNVGAGLIPDAEEMEATYDAVEKRSWRRSRTRSGRVPHRIDEIIVFHGLGKAELAQIVELLLTHLRRQVEAQGMDLEVTPEAAAFIASRGTTRSSAPVRSSAPSSA